MFGVEVDSKLSQKGVEHKVSSEKQTDRKPNPIKDPLKQRTHNSNEELIRSDVPRLCHCNLLILFGLI